MSNHYQICVNCVMDTSDPQITFNDNGLCEYCQNYEAIIKPDWEMNTKDSKKLDDLSDQIRQQGSSSDFDCIIGLSGGLDSSYAAYVAVEQMNLRPLLVHVDAGWNTEQAVWNIEKLVNGLGLDLYTDVVNWEAVKNMQLSFLKSGIPDQDLVQDAAFFSGLYAFAREYKIKNVITGSNYSTECCREPEEWGGYLGIDKILFNDIWKKHGTGKRNHNFPLVDILRYKIFYQMVMGMKMHYPLNMTKYIKSEAEKELEEKFDWKPFQHKHHESRFTRFYEDYWLPKRFGYEKRRAHFSSLIMTDQMTRPEAIERLKQPEMDSYFLKQEFDYVASKLSITPEELQLLFELPLKTYKDFKNKRNLIIQGANLMRFIGLEKRYFR